MRHQETATMTRPLLASMLLAIAVMASATTKLLENIPLQWRPTSQLRLGTTQMIASSVTIAPFTDGRDDEAAIGENREDNAPKPVTTGDDVGAFVSTRMRQLFDEAGMKTVDGDGKVVINGEVKKFFVREESTYKSVVEIQLTVLGESGKVLWKGLASGEATRFGRSYKAENYYEVLSDAVVNTVSSMLQAAEFQKAMAGQAADSAT
jgi:hypothetical protein